MFKMSVKVVVSSPREVKDKGFYGEFFFFGGSISVPLNASQADFFRSNVGEEMELSFDMKPKIQVLYGDRPVCMFYPVAVFDTPELKKLPTASDVCRR